MNNDMKLTPMQSPELMQSKESWRVFGIMSEFVSATERLRHIHPAVSIFGSAHPARPPLLQAHRRDRAPAVGCRILGHLRRRPRHHGSSKQGRLLWQVVQ